MKTRKLFPTVAIDRPLSSIRFIVLTDGTVYENCRYECGKILKQEEYTDILEHCTCLLCGNVPISNRKGALI